MLGIVHGSAAQPPPEMLTKPRPPGVTSVKTTFVALSGPALCTATVKTTLPPGVADAGATLSTWMSAAVNDSAVDELSLLSASVVSTVLVVADAVFTIGSGVV